jgi:hypothetical protein
VALNRKGSERHVISTDAAMARILALLVEAREERFKGDRDAPKVEVLLAKAGLTKDDIAAVTGKQPDAIRKAIERTKSKKRSKP